MDVGAREMVAIIFVVGGNFQIDKMRPPLPYAWQAGRPQIRSLGLLLARDLKFFASRACFGYPIANGHEFTIQENDGNFQKLEVDGPFN